MKTFNINNKRLGITFVVVGLVLVLFGMQTNFQHNINEIALMNNGLKDFKEYKAFDDKLIYTLPEAWKVKDYEHKLSDVLYHIEFSSIDRGINGYIQVWPGEKVLDAFVDRSKNYETTGYAYDKYAMSKIEIGSNEGFEVSYDMNSDNKNYNVYEYFIKEKNNIFKIAFSVDKNKNKESNYLIFKEIINNIKYNE